MRTIRARAAVVAAAAVLAACASVHGPGETVVQVRTGPGGQRILWLRS